MSRSQMHKQYIQTYNTRGDAGQLARPVLGSLTPSTAANGTTGTLTIAGQNFTTGDVLNFRGVDYAITTLNNRSSMVSVTVPKGAAGTVQAYVKKANGLVSNSVNFVVT